MQSINLIDNQLVKSFVVQIWFRKNGYHLSLNRTEFESESTNANIGKNLQTVKESGQALSERYSSTKDSIEDKRMARIVPGRFLPCPFVSGCLLLVLV